MGRQGRIGLWQGWVPSSLDGKGKVCADGCSWAADVLVGRRECSVLGHLFFFFLNKVEV